MKNRVTKNITNSDADSTVWREIPKLEKSSVSAGFTSKRDFS